LFFRESEYQFQDFLNFKDFLLLKLHYLYYFFNLQYFLNFLKYLKFLIFLFHSILSLIYLLLSIQKFSQPYSNFLILEYLIVNFLHVFLEQPHLLWFPLLFYFLLSLNFHFNLFIKFQLNFHF
jgi:hypothetical protein